METSGADRVRETPEAPPPPEPVPPPPEPALVAAAGEHHGFLGEISKAVGGVAGPGLLQGVGDLTAGVADQLGKLVGPASDLTRALERGPSAPDAPPAAPPAPDADWQQKFAQAEVAGHHLEDLQRRAQQLLQSGSPADQLRGQQELQQAQQLMEALTRANQAQSDTASRAIEDLK